MIGVKVRIKIRVDDVRILFTCCQFGRCEDQIFEVFELDRIFRSVEIDLLVLFGLLLLNCDFFFVLLLARTILKPSKSHHFLCPIVLFSHLRNTFFTYRSVSNLLNNCLRLLDFLFLLFFLGTCLRGGHAIVNLHIACLPSIIKMPKGLELNYCVL